MAKLMLRFVSEDAQLFKARIRDKQTGKSLTVYIKAQWSIDAEAKLRAQFGKSHTVFGVKAMTPMQVIRAAERHLPRMPLVYKCR